MPTIDDDDSGFAVEDKDGEDASCIDLEDDDVRQ